MVKDSVKSKLAQETRDTTNAEDLKAFQEREREPNLDFEQFVKTLERRGKL